MYQLSLALLAIKMMFGLTLDEGRFLINLARSAVEEKIKRNLIITLSSKVSSKLMERHGVFVTINSLKEGRKKLRGCIGLPYPTQRLASGVIEAAISSAMKDPRFPRVTREELDTIVFEISVLTVPELISAESGINYLSKIKVGIDGLIIERGGFRGLLLPQVPVELDWDEEQFLCQCCMKAGLSPDCWLLKETKIYKFQCCLVEELEPKGEIRILTPEDLLKERKEHTG